MIDLMCLCQLYERYEIAEIKWISGDTNLVDAMTKSKPCCALEELININKLYIEVSAWVERLAVLLIVCTLKHKNMVFTALISTTID